MSDNSRPWATGRKHEKRMAAVIARYNRTCFINETPPTALPAICFPRLQSCLENRKHTKPITGETHSDTGDRIVVCFPVGPRAISYKPAILSLLGF